MSLQSYIQETRSEFKHVKWLTPTETWQYAALVVAISVAVAAFLALCDYLFITLLGYLLIG